MSELPAPGSSTPPRVPDAPSPGVAHKGEPHCLTCGDLAEQMRVLSVDPAVELALCVDARSREVTVDTGLLGAVLPGETLLVHAGAALARVGGDSA